MTEMCLYLPADVFKSMNSREDQGLPKSKIGVQGRWTVSRMDLAQISELVQLQIKWSVQQIQLDSNVPCREQSP